MYLDESSRCLNIPAVSSKTEHYEGGGILEVPLFPEVRTVLEELFLEPDGGELVIPVANRDRTTNLQTTFEKIVTRAALLQVCDEDFGEADAHSDAAHVCKGRKRLALTEPHQRTNPCFAGVCLPAPKSAKSSSCPTRIRTSTK